jgi:flagellar biosynthesis protein FlhF
MKLKKYYAGNMQEALKSIKEEIGPDAVILSSKFVRVKKGFLGLFSKKQIEVVAGYEEKNSPAKQNTVVPDVKKFSQILNANPAEEQRAIVNSAAASMEKIVEKNIRETNEKFKKVEVLNQSIGELKNMISGLSSRMESYNTGIEVKFSSEVRELYNKLIENDVEKGLATELCVKTEDIVSSRGAEPREVLKSLIMDVLGTARPVQCTKFKRKVVMLIGPTGVGKTTTLVKLAAKLLYEDKLDIGVINADVFRVAAKEHLRAYCEILDADMITIYRREEIAEALDAFKTKDIVFIDTAGKLSSNEQYREEIKDLVRLGHVDDIYLLVSASTSEKVIKAILDNYAFLKIHNIIMTKVDETPTRGVVVYTAKTSGRPLSYMTNGQNVPDDIVEVNPEDIVQAVLEN